MEGDIFNTIYNIIEAYKEKTLEDPYVILIQPKVYLKLREYLETSNHWRYLSKIKKDIDKVSYIFGVPVEISNYIIQPAIAINKRCYNEYCYYKYMKEWENINY